jgi:hypothetical protein
MILNMLNKEIKQPIKSRRKKLWYFAFTQVESWKVFKWKIEALHKFSEVVIVGFKIFEIMHNFFVFRDITFKD